MQFESITCTYTLQKLEVCALLQNVGVFYFSLHVMKNEKNNNMIFLYTGAGERFLPRGGPILKKKFFYEFSKFLLNKSLILGGVRPPQTPPVPWPLTIVRNKEMLYAAPNVRSGATHVICSMF